LDQEAGVINHKFLREVDQIRKSLVTAWSTGATVAGQCLSLKILSPIPIRRGQPAQRLQVNV